MLFHLLLSPPLPPAHLRTLPRAGTFLPSGLPPTTRNAVATPSNLPTPRSYPRRTVSLVHPTIRPYARLAATTYASPPGGGGGSKTVIELEAQDLTPESFAPFGHVVSYIEDFVPYNPETDPKLVLSNGTPRFYILRLRDKKLGFDSITFHGRTTQCLGGLGNKHWYMGVSEATMSLDRPPRAEDLTVFRVPPETFVSLHVGTWHAGPLFSCPYMDFYNLELTDTNITDHQTHQYATQNVEFAVNDPQGDLSVGSTLDEWCETSTE